MTDWSNVRTMEFLEAYRRQPALWDPYLEGHKDRHNLATAWNRLSKELNIPVAELKRKKDSLMASFRSHIRKKKASIVAGEDVHKPIWFAYDFMEQFLGPVYDVAPEEAPEWSIEYSIKGENDSSDEVLEPVQSLLEEASEPPVSYEAPAEQTVNIPTSQDSLLQGITVTNAHEEDECDLYGRLLAKRLRRMPEEDRELMMYEIDGLLIKRRQAKSANDVS